MSVQPYERHVVKCMFTYRLSLAERNTAPNVSELHREIEKKKKINHQKCYIKLKKNIKKKQLRGNLNLCANVLVQLRSREGVRDELEQPLNGIQFE